MAVPPPVRARLPAPVDDIDLRYRNAEHEGEGHEGGEQDGVCDTMSHDAFLPMRVEGKVARGFIIYEQEEIEGLQ